MFSFKNSGKKLLSVHIMHTGLFGEKGILIGFGKIGLEIILQDPEQRGKGEKGKKEERRE